MTEGGIETKAIFETPFIVQRLLKPYERKSDFEEGIIIKKGLDVEVGEVFEHIMDFDYMGSSEFEWGALPTSLEYAIKYAKDNDFVACEIDVVSRKFNLKPIFYLCHKDMEEKVVAWIRKAAKNEHPRCIEGVRLDNVLDSEEFYEKMCGWYDLKNRFWFFTDRNMFLDVKKLFGVK